MSRFRCLVLAAATASLFTGSAVNADVIYNNLPPISGSTGTDQASVDGPLFNSFSTGASTTTLADVTLLLSGDPTSGSQFTVSLLRDASTSPGAVLENLGTFNDSLLSTTTSTFDVPLSTPFALAADTRVLDRVGYGRLRLPVVRGVELRGEHSRSGYERGILGVQPGRRPHGHSKL